MTPVALVVAGLLSALPPTMTAATVQAPDSPIRLDSAAIANVGSAPPVLIYSATNLTDDAFEQFTVIAFVFTAEGRLKARQTAPARRTLDPRGNKYSTLVLDGSPIEATDVVVVGVNQAQHAHSEAWWRGDVQPLAEQAAKSRKR